MSRPVLKIRQSELSQWASCRRKTVLQYAEGWKRKRSGLILPPSKADIGTLVHSGLEHYYRDNMQPHMFIAEQGKRIAAEHPDGLPKAWTDAYNLAFLMTKGYMQWIEQTGIDAGLVITGVEREMEVYWGEVAGYDVFVVGHIDLEALDALGRPVLIDHKSVQTHTDGSGVPDFQRLTYAVLRMLEDGTRYGALYHNELRRVKRTAAAKPPFYARPEIQINEAQLRKHWQHMNVIIGEIVSARAALDAGMPLDSPTLYPRPSRDCSWSCPYVNVCGMMDDGADWEWYLQDVFERGEAHVPGREEEE